MKLTAPAVAKLRVPDDKSELLVFDDDLPGFGIRIRAGGSRTWIVQYQIGGRQRRASLGKVAGLAPDKARVEAGKVLAKVRLGYDPQADKFKMRSDAALTLGAIAQQFLERKQETLRPRTLLEVQRHLNEHWKPLHKLQISSIDRRTVAQRISKLSEEHGRSSADHARTALSSLFSWAVKEGFADANPVAATNRPLDPVSRDRVLEARELQEIWNACRDDDYGRIVRLLILTGQRRDEIASLRWSEIDLDAALISLPKERTKNKRGHDVPLSDAALAALPSPRQGRDLVFGEGDEGFSGFSKAKQKLDARIHEARRERDKNAKPIADWRLHDIRRTVATGLADLGVQPHVIEAVLNHVSGHKAGVAGIYNKASYSKEKRAALNLWAEHVTTRKVVPLPARRGAK